MTVSAEVSWPAGAAPEGRAEHPGLRSRIVAGGLAAAVALIVVLVAVARSGGGPNAGTPSVSLPHGATARAPAPLGAEIGAGGGAVGMGTGGSGTALGAAGSTAAGSTAGAAAPGVPATAPSQPNVVPPATAGAKVVKTGSADLTVPRHQLQPALGRLTSLAAAESGFVAATSTSDAGASPSGAITLRVPSASFEDALNQVRHMGTVGSVSTSGQDVTAQSVDLQARVTALQDAESRYLSILARATTIGDILAVQQQIDSIQTQLDQLQGQQRVMDDQTTYATLTVNVAEGTPGTPPPPGPAAGWSRAWHDAVHGFADAAQAIVAASGVLLFVALCVAALAALGWGVRRRYRRPAV